MIEFNEFELIAIEKVIKRCNDLGILHQVMYDEDPKEIEEILNEVLIKLGDVV